MLKYNDKEVINIKTRKTVYFLTAIAVISIGAWLFKDASNEEKPQNNIASDINNEDLNSEYPLNSEPKTEEFKLKDENEYVQLRLSVTSVKGKKESVEEYIKDHLDVKASEDYSGNLVLSSPKEEYDLALSTIIDCPYTENVLYKNEDYYPVACEIYDKSSEEGKISSQAAEYIENIEEMCESVIIIVN